MMTAKMKAGRTQDWLNLILAALLFFSPWFMGYADDVMPTRNAWIVGVALGALALATLSVLAEWEEWVTVVLGLWLIVSPWLLHFAADTHVMATHVVLGVLVVAASAWAVWDFRHPHAHA